MVGVQYTICYWAINRTDPQNLLSTTIDVPLQLCTAIWRTLLMLRLGVGLVPQYVLCSQSLEKRGDC